MKQGTPENTPIIIENEVSERHLEYSYKNKKSLYGITKEQFLELVKKQNSKCASCGDSAVGSEHTLCVDHCHNTLEIRGLICSGCNTAAGWLDDDPEKAEKLARYLKSEGTGLFTDLQTRHINE
jgi:ribosomal protein S27AE